MASIALTTFALSIALFQMTSCKKASAQPNSPTTCDVKGIYSGTNLASTGASSTIAYNLQDNNFAVGSLTTADPAVTFGGYRNTCDSVFLSVYYTGNSCYYLLEGKLSNSGTTISGTFKNLTITSDYGTFTMSK